MKFREIEKLILADGWTFKSAKGSHHQLYIPYHSGDIAPIIAKLILKQAGL